MSSPRLTYDTFRKIAPAAHDALLAMGKSDRWCASDVE